MEDEPQGYVYGMIARELDAAMRRRGSALTEAEMRGMPADPVRWLGVIMRRATAMGALAPEVDERLGRLMELIEIDAAPRPGERSEGSWWLGWQRYDTSQMSAEEAARELGVTTQRVYALLKAGRLHGYRVGREWRVFARGVAARARSERAER